MAYTGTYEQELRKNPTDYKLRAMGKKKYELRRRESDGKVTISTKDDPKTRKDFGVGTKRVIDEKKKKTLLKKGGLDREAELALKREKEKANEKSSQREVKTSKDDVRKTDNEGPRKRKIELQNKQKKDVNIPRQALENILTGTAGAGLLLGGYAKHQLNKKKKADKMRMAADKLKNMKPEQQKKVLKETIKRTMDKMKNAKPSLKQKIKTQLAKLRQKLSSGLKRSGGGVGGNINVTPGGTGNLPPIKGRFKKTDINL